MYRPEINDKGGKICVNFVNFLVNETLGGGENEIDGNKMLFLMSNFIVNLEKCLGIPEDNLHVR